MYVQVNIEGIVKQLLATSKTKHKKLQKSIWLFWIFILCNVLNFLYFIISCIVLANYPKKYFETVQHYGPKTLQAILQQSAVNKGTNMFTYCAAYCCSGAQKKALFFKSLYWCNLKIKSKFSLIWKWLVKATEVLHPESIFGFFLVWEEQRTSTCLCIVRAGSL